jgi:RNA polymerase sigma-70 factor (ECF subfamily)
MPQIKATHFPKAQIELVYQQEKSAVVHSENLISQAFAVDIWQGYELLFRSYYKLLCNQVMRFTYVQDVAEDIVADVFIDFWKNQIYRHITTSYRAYLYQAVGNQVYNQLQTEFRHFNQSESLVELEWGIDTITEDPRVFFKA